MAEQSITTDPKELFNRWFARPIARLEALEYGDGGTAGMMIVLPLYDRYIYIISGLRPYLRRPPKREREQNKAKFLQTMAADLGLANLKDAQKFWETLRHGFCHSGMPFESTDFGKTLPKVLFSSDYSERPEFHNLNNQEILCLDPWKFIHHVMRTYEQDPSLLNDRPGAPLLIIHTVSQDNNQYVTYSGACLPVFPKN